MQIALKVDVDTLRGTLEGVPALLRLFERFGVRATFLFSLGPDHTGRAIKRVFRPGFLTKVRRTSVASHYGIRTLLYGTLLPGPDIGRRARDVMRAAAAGGHERGIHCHDHIRWQDQVARRDAAWTRREMERAAEAFVRVFGRPAHAHGAAATQSQRFFATLRMTYLVKQQMVCAIAARDSCTVPLDYGIIDRLSRILSTCIPSCGY